MSIYGRKTTVDGETVEENSNFKSPVVGSPEKPFVNNVSIEDIAYNKSESGVEMGIIIFKQENGSQVKETIFPANPNFQQPVEEQGDLINRRMKHIVTKFSGITGEDYDSRLSETDSFKDFIEQIGNFVRPQFDSNKFRVKFVYNKKGYVSLPKYPNFIENMTVPEDETQIGYSPSYDTFTKSNPDAEEITEKVANSWDN